MRYHDLHIMVAAAVASLAACVSSPPARYYALTPVPPPATSAPGRPAATVAVGPIELPQYLNRPQIVTRKAGNELALDELNRWAEPVAAGFLSVLCVDLRAELGSADIHAYPVPASVAVTHRLTARVERFEPDASGNAVLVIDWRLLDGDGRPLRPPQHGNYRAAIARGTGYDAVAAALSDTIAQLAKDLAAAL
jgi:uncharacterized lipoprotein YmbA